MRKLANWRKGASVIHHGKTMHFGAENGTYVFFRYDGTPQSHGGHEPRPGPGRAADRALCRDPGRRPRLSTDVISGQRFALETALTLAPRSVVVLEIE
ncbi:hypothetical protein LP420_27860 [Massilia sp. B-10]|nr:hypothetical protein LP420_27860 [Massilia sp. B-10]